MRALLKGIIVCGLLALVFSQNGWAKNRHPSSGRRLAYGHWLTCWGGDDSRLRRDPPFYKNSPEEEVAAYIPKFSGNYSFEVKDTWEEWVTHSGSSCSHCGETCRSVRNSDGSTSQDCSCNSCSWQELETFYRPWSTQQVTWSAQWMQSEQYRNRRKEWLKEGSPDLSKENLQQLFEFDPDRPLEYFLFPGEVERLRVSNFSGFFSSSDNLSPTVWVDQARHDYTPKGKGNVSIYTNAPRECDDRDFSLRAEITTGTRLVTKTPNSIEFRTDWIQGAKDSSGNLTDETAAFELTDLSAMRYEGQDVFDHYKHSKVEIAMWQVKRWLWLAPLKMTTNFRIEDNLSVIRFPETNDKSPPLGTYHLTSSDLFVSRWFKNPFHIMPGQSYDVCATVTRQNNIYYKTDSWLGGNWSEWNCSRFTFKPEASGDLRGGGRKFRDALSRFIPFI